MTLGFIYYSFKTDEPTPKKVSLVVLDPVWYFSYQQNQAVSFFVMFFVGRGIAGLLNSSRCQGE